MSDIDLVLQDGLSIDEVTKEAFTILGANGVIRVAGDHSCSECTQEYKATADVISSSSAADADAEGSDSNNEDMQIDNTSVQMVVLDEIVTGPLVCALFDFNSKLMA
jgi:hypothetical protein